MQEIEVKYRVFELQAIQAALDARGVVLSSPVKQDDQAYAPSGWAYGQPKTGVPFARLRTQDGRHLFTVKTPVANELACLEHETVVADRDQMHEAIVSMGFVPTVRIVKTRRSATIDQVEVCVDEVEHAGLFLELETLVGPGVPGPVAQGRLDDFARGLGVRLERVSDTYDSLVRQALSLV